MCDSYGRTQAIMTVQKIPRCARDDKSRNRDCPGFRGRPEFAPEVGREIEDPRSSERVSSKRNVVTPRRESRGTRKASDVANVRHGQVIPNRVASRSEVCARRSDTVRVAFASCADRKLDALVVLRREDSLKSESWIRARRHYRLTADAREWLRRERETTLRMWRGVSLLPGGRRR